MNRRAANAQRGGSSTPREPLGAHGHVMPMVMLHQSPQLSALYDTAKHTTSQPHIRFASKARKT